MLNISNYKIITTKKDIERITAMGCIICNKNDFVYYNNYSLVECCNCRSIYAFSLEGVIKMLEAENGKVRIYNNTISLIDDDKRDFEVKYEREGVVKKKMKVSDK